MENAESENRIIDADAQTKQFTKFGYIFLINLQLQRILNVGSGVYAVGFSRSGVKAYESCIKHLKYILAPKVDEEFLKKQKEIFKKMSIKDLETNRYTRERYYSILGEFLEALVLLADRRNLLEDKEIDLIFNDPQK